MINKIILVHPSGYCAGVERATKLLDLALKRANGNVYSLHEIVHNTRVVMEFESKGVVFTDSIDDIPDGSVVVFSAHGVSHKIRMLAEKKRLQIVDATCPLVMKVHWEARRYIKEGYYIIYVGHKGHPETVGVTGEINNDKCFFVETILDVEQLTIGDSNTKKIILLNQTTLSVEELKDVVEALKNKFPNMELPPSRDICYATQNRQDAVKKLALKVDTILVVGSRNSSNSCRLRDLSESLGVKAFLVDNICDLQDGLLVDSKVLGITAGASTPEYLIHEITTEVQRKWGGAIEQLETVKENINFITV